MFYFINFRKRDLDSLKFELYDGGTCYGVFLRVCFYFSIFITVVFTPIYSLILVLYLTFEKQDHNDNGLKSIFLQFLVTNLTIIIVRVISLLLQFKRPHGAYNWAKWKIILLIKDEHRGGVLEYDKIGNVVGFIKDETRERGNTETHEDFGMLLDEYLKADKEDHR